LAASAGLWRRDVGATWCHLKARIASRDDRVAEQRGRDIGCARNVKEVDPSVST
jgi:hypothetical protein